MPPEQEETGIGTGMLLTIVALAGAAAVLAVLVVTRHHQRRHATSTVFVTRAAPAAHAQSHPAATTAATTAATATTEPATTEQRTTTQSRATVPSVAGDLQSALQAVRNAGFAATVHYVPSTQPRGTVVAQSPAGGTTAPMNAQVTINVSSGENTAEVSVPNTVGMTIPQAVSAVQGAGLHLVMLRRTVTDQTQAGTVVAQTPGAGQRAPKNSRVVVYMGALTG
jgi:eukaryotic-like serine/threonine-protein kinase